MKLDRLIGILTILLQNDRVTTPYLAEKFEVNRRTISRDIDTLCQAGIPIVTYQGAGGGISIMEGFRLDKHVLTTGELMNMLAALKGLGSILEKKHIEQTLDKLGAGSDAVVSLDEPIVIDLASYYQGSLTAKIETIKQAILNHHIIEFDYFYERGECHRWIEPYLVMFQQTSWYVFGFCLERMAWRRFKLNRLWSLSLCDQQFAPRVIPPGQHTWQNHLIDDQRFAALFDKSVKYLLIEAYGPDCFQETADGLYFEVSYTNRSYMISWLLSFGDKVKVLEPYEMARELQAIAKNILSHYE